MRRLFDERIHRVERAHLVIDLDELLALARREGRVWVTLEEWARVRAHGSRWTAEAFRQDRARVGRALGECGATLPYDEPTVDEDARVHVDTASIRRAVEPQVRAARLYVARRLNDAVAASGIEDESEVLSLATVALEYRGTLKSFKLIQRKHGVGWARLRRMIASEGPVPSRLARVRTEQRRPAALMARARQLAQGGATTSELAALLECSHVTAWRWLRREGFVAAGRGRAATWSLEPHKAVGGDCQHESENSRRVSS